MPNRVFFIDDDKSFLYLMNRLCEKIDNIEAVYTANNGLDACNKIDSWLKDNHRLPNIMFIDINMPIMNGFQFLEKFREKVHANPNLSEISQIYILSSSAEQSDKEKAMRFDFVKEFINKPSGTKDVKTMLIKYTR